MEQAVLEAGHIFRDQQVSDFGIDVHIEIKDGAIATGRLIAAQIKTGSSYFSKGNDTGFFHYVSDRHRSLWINHSLPVILVLCDVEARVCYYEVVTEETCVRAGASWRILVPRCKTITAASSPELHLIASPIVAASEYSIHAEHDQSHANARRVSLDIVVHSGNKAITKPFLGAIVRAAVKEGQSSQYHRDEILEKLLGGRPVEVVWGFVYLRDSDRESAAWACRFQWVSQSLKGSARPRSFEGEQDGSGLVIDWAGDMGFPKFLDERRATKANYLKRVDRLLAQLPAVREELDSIIERGDQSPHSAEFKNLSSSFESMWDDSFSAPVECQRLNQAIHELLATVGNAGLNWDQRKSRDPERTRSLMKHSRDELVRIDRDIAFLRRDVR